ncbi:hypothetical protein FSPOR_3094 [Fusarium sporotrichioides]|uniref:Heterokaryon incompatibility domain-containing protein n=1 Tax=Fusarium sporotrichioides TaxID=5514 RepID=A0A395SIT6_FUSSP|nr:hypothetical protein FSPOR_3094 [Fusarium sporotrichioides]
MDPVSLAVSIIPLSEQLVKTIKTIKKLISTYKRAAKELESLACKLGHVEVICESIEAALETGCLSDNHLTGARLPSLFPISSDAATQPKHVEHIAKGWRISFLQLAFLQKTQKRNMKIGAGGSDPLVIDDDSILTAGSTWLNWYIKLSLRNDHLSSLRVTLTVPSVIPLHHMEDRLGTRVREAFYAENVEAVQQLFNERAITPTTQITWQEYDPDHECNLLGLAATTRAPRLFEFMRSQTNRAEDIMHFGGGCIHNPDEAVESLHCWLDMLELVGVDIDQYLQYETSDCLATWDESSANWHMLLRGRDSYIKRTLHVGYSRDRLIPYWREDINRSCLVHELLTEFPRFLHPETIKVYTNAKATMRYHQAWKIGQNLELLGPEKRSWPVAPVLVTEQLPNDPAPAAYITEEYKIAHEWTERACNLMKSRFERKQMRKMRRQARKGKIPGGTRNVQHESKSMATRHDLLDYTSENENDIISSLVEIQKCRVPQQKMRWIVENLECLGRQQSRKRKIDRDEGDKFETPFWFRKNIDGFTDSNFVALSYTWDASDYETQNPKDEGHLIETRDREEAWCSAVRNSVLERITKYMQCHDVPLLWIDRHSIPQKIYAMDWVYSLSDHPVALLGRPIQSEDEMTTLSAILRGVLVKYHDGRPALSKDAEYSQALKMLDLLYEITRDKWWTRAWTFQENYKAGLNMTLLIYHDTDLESAKRSMLSGKKAMFGVVPGELSIQSVRFSESATKFCLAFRRHHFATNEDEEKITHILKTAGRYRILLSHSASMSGIIVSDVEWRGITEPWDRLAIIANCCQYDTRLDTARLQQNEANVPSLDLSVLALRLLNGEILNNEEVYVPDGTVLEQMNDLFFADFKAPEGGRRLTYNKGCRFVDAEFTKTGIKTKGHLWKLGETLRAPRSSPRLSQPNQKDKQQLSEYQRTRLRQVSELIKAKHSREDMEIVEDIKDLLREDAFVSDDEGSFSLWYRRLMAKEVIRAMDADQSLSLGYLCDLAGEPTTARGIFIHDRDVVDSNEFSSQADKEPAYVFTSLWSDGYVDEEYLANELDHHVSLGVRLSNDNSQEPLQLYTQQWVLGLCFFTNVPTYDVVFPWPQVLMKGSP